MSGLPLKRILHAIAWALAVAGCSQLVTVTPTKPPLPFTGNEDPALVAANNQLRDAARLERTDPSHALGDYLGSAQSALARLDERPKDVAAQQVYNFSVARSIGLIEAAHLNPWGHALEVPTATGRYSLTGVRHADPDRDPASYQLIPADSLNVGGTLLKKRVRLEGIGAPVVAIGREEKKDFRKSFTTQRLYGGATGIVRFRGQRAELEFFQPLMTKQVSLGRHTYPLAADLSTAAAVGLTRERPDKLALVRMLRPEKYDATARLTRLQTYDPERIPVIFVHGLQDTPVSWVPMINALREDPEIRDRYQFWVYSYPSGYPFPYSASLFRHELDAVSRTFPNRKGIILIGHSMGGLLSRLMVTDAGQKIWMDYFDKPPSQVSLPVESKQLLEDALIFNHRPEVRRVIFISTPHRGSEMAGNWIGRIGTSLIRMPFFFASIPFRAIEGAMTEDPGAMELKRIPNSIDTLAPNNRFVRELDKFPITPGVPYHSIIGDRGRGNTPNSSDGVVPYWSSHLKGAESELIVPSNHSAPANPQAIAEVRRILKLHR
jgi:pimeloyl-ACP methyl ester carboxylesterase